jgi:hypothetical protein
MNLPITQLEQISREGSPAALHAFGRLYGLGEAEQQQLWQVGIPKWAVLVGGVLLGMVAGAYVQKRWPTRVNSWVWRRL